MQTPTSPDHPQIESPQAAVYARIARASHLIFLAALALFIIATPFIGALPGGELVNTALLTLVLASGLLVIQAHRGTLVLATALLVPGVAAKSINYYRPELMPAAVCP